MWLVVLLYILGSFVRNRKWSATVLLILLVIFGVYVLNKGNFHVINQVLKRLSKDSEIGGITNGRLNLWKDYLHNITGSIQYIVYGHGFSSRLLNGMGPHNFYIELWYYLGIAGVTIVVFLLAKCITAGKIIMKHSFVNLFPIISLAVMYFFLQMFFSNELVFHIIIVYLLSNTQLES